MNWLDLLFKRAPARRLILTTDALPLLIKALDSGAVTCPWGDLKINLLHLRAMPETLVFVHDTSPDATARALLCNHSKSCESTQGRNMQLVVKELPDGRLRIAPLTVLCSNYIPTMCGGRTFLLTNAVEGAVLMHSRYTYPKMDTDTANQIIQKSIERVMPKYEMDQRNGLVIPQALVAKEERRIGTAFVLCIRRAAAAIAKQRGYSFGATRARSFRVSKGITACAVISISDDKAHAQNPVDHALTHDWVESASKLVFTKDGDVISYVLPGGRCLDSCHRTVPPLSIVSEVHAQHYRGEPPKVPLTKERGFLIALLRHLADPAGTYVNKNAVLFMSTRLENPLNVTLHSMLALVRARDELRECGVELVVNEHHAATNPNERFHYVVGMFVYIKDPARLRAYANKIEEDYV